VLLGLEIAPFCKDYIFVKPKTTAKILAMQNLLSVVRCIEVTADISRLSMLN
jgi:hypothetical protein